MQKWLSFIVPIYNAENYLKECVDSLLNQDFSKELYEIILYDDGSTDNSLSIAKEYAANFSNVRVFTHPNLGVSNTRNAGISEATGEYIWFVDSDDRIVKDILPILHEWTSILHVDMLIFNSVNFSESYNWKIQEFSARETAVITGQKAFMGFYYNPVPWNKLLCRAFVEKYHLYFTESLQLSEDGEWGTRCFYHGERVKTIAVDALYYRVYAASASHNVSNRKKLLERGLLPCLEYHYKYMLNYPGVDYWMRAFILDLRRIHRVFIDLDKICTKEEKRIYIAKEKEIVGKIVHNLPISLSLDYIILLISAVSPTLILNLQIFLRKVKEIKSKISRN